MKTIDKYILSDQIGQGQYGKVYKAINSITNQTFAIKVVKLTRFKQIPKLTQFTMNEVETLKKIQNPNVIKFIELFNSKNNLYLVYEFCEGGNLEEYIQKYGVLSESNALERFLQLINAFESLIAENILHRDLKPSNILIHNQQLKVADFGFCKTLDQGDLTQTMVGSPIYMAPEILLGEPYNFSADIWSLGVCLYEMLFGRCPYEDVTIPRLMFQIQNAQLVFPREINNISEGLERLLRKMLTINPQYRITWAELFQLRSESKQLKLPQHQQSQQQIIQQQQQQQQYQQQYLSTNSQRSRQMTKSPNRQANVSPIRQASSPYQQIFSKKNSNYSLAQNYVQINLRLILEQRKRQQERQQILIRLLEVNESVLMPQIALYLIRSLVRDMYRFDIQLQFEGNTFQKWDQFRMTPFYERCLQIQKDDQGQLGEIENLVIQELLRSQMPIDSLSLEQFKLNSREFSIFLGQNQHLSLLKDYNLMLKSMGVQ